jgi:hypothetical protein
LIHSNGSLAPLQLKEVYEYDLFTYKGDVIELKKL